MAMPAFRTIGRHALTVLVLIVNVSHCLAQLTSTSSARVEFDLPTGTTISTRGKPLRINEPWIINNPKRWTYYPLKIKLPDEITVERQLLLEPGQTVRVALPAVGAGTTRLVLQSGHAAAITAMEINNYRQSR